MGPARSRLGSKAQVKPWSFELLFGKGRVAAVLMKILLFPRFLSSLRSRLKLLHPSPNCSLREDSVVHVHFKEEIGIAELIPLVTTYIILFAYIYFSTRRSGGSWLRGQGCRLLSVTPLHFPPVPAGEVVLEFYPELSQREFVTVYLMPANWPLLASVVVFLVICLPSWKCFPIPGSVHGLR